MSVTLLRTCHRRLPPVIPANAGIQVRFQSPPTASFPRPVPRFGEKAAAEGVQLRLATNTPRLRASSAAADRLESTPLPAGRIFDKRGID